MTSPDGFVDESADVSKFGSNIIMSRKSDQVREVRSVIYSKVRGGRRSTKVFGDKILSRSYKSHKKLQFYYNYSSDMLIITCLMIDCNCITYPSWMAQL